MIVKISTVKKLKNLFDYLLYKNGERRDKAELLMGERTVIEMMVKNSRSRLHKCKQIILSFAEKIENDKVNDIVEEYCCNLLAIPRNEYYLFCVVHNDKQLKSNTSELTERTDVHILIPNINLKTGSSIVVYNDALDFKLKDRLHKFIEEKYKLIKVTDRKREIASAGNFEKYDFSYIKNSKEDITYILQKEIQENNITDYSSLKNTINGRNYNFSIVRAGIRRGTPYITVKLNSDVKSVDIEKTENNNNYNETYNNVSVKGEFFRQIAESYNPKRKTEVIENINLEQELKQLRQRKHDYILEHYKKDYAEFNKQKKQSDSYNDETTDIRLLAMIKKEKVNEKELEKYELNEIDFFYENFSTAEINNSFDTLDEYLEEKRVNEK